MNVVPVALRNMFHHKGRLGMNVLGIAAALMLIMLLVGLRTGLYATLTAYIDHSGADLIVAQSGVSGMYSSDSALAQAIHDELLAEAGAQEGGHILVADVIFTRGDVKTPVILVGYPVNPRYGGPWSLGAGRFARNDREIMLDEWLAERSGVELGDQVELLGRDFEVVGLTRGTSSWMSPYAFISLDAAQSALGVSGIVSYHMLTLPEGADAGQVQERLAQRFAGVSVLSPKEIGDADRRVVATILDRPILVLLGIGSVIGAAVMGLTAYSAVSDRLREFGVLLAVGAGPGRLVRLALAETLYHAVLGYAGAILLSYAAAAAIMAVWPQFNILIRPEVIGQAGLLAVVMTAVAAVIPIRRILRVDPMTVFKS
ncbi:MAG: ABC transporter permease [Chloroflexi bacterium]|nr:ABC transporter permease [Chloroflexota bacterium]